MPINPTNQLHSECSGIAVGLLTSCCCHCAHPSSSTSRRSPDLRGGTMMASGPAAGRSASTQRSTVAGDAKPIVTMIECEAGHTQRALLNNSTDHVSYCQGGRLHRPASHGLRPSPPSVTSPSARSRTHTHGSQGGTDSQTQPAENATGQMPRLILTCRCESRRARRARRRLSPPSVRSRWPMPSGRRGARLAH